MSELHTPFVDTLNNTDLSDAANIDQYGGPIQDLESGKTIFLTASGAVNAYEVVFPSPLVIGAANEGLRIHFVANLANTGAVTLKVNGLSPQAVVVDGDVPLSAGAIAAGQVVAVVWDGSQFQMLSAPGSASGGVNSFNGRSGAVVPEAGDYSASQISGVMSGVQGGTGQSSYTKGDLLVGQASNTLARQTVGLDGQRLLADSSQTDGVRFGSPLPLLRAPFLQPSYVCKADVSGGAYGYAPAVCSESSPPVMAFLAYSGGWKYFFFYRASNGRWRPVGASGLGVETPGQAVFSLSGPVGTDPQGIVYVPSKSGGGAGRGKFWISSSTNEYVRVVDPADLSYADYQIGTSANAISTNSGMVFSPDLEKVFAIMGNGTRVVQIDADSVTQDTSVTSLNYLQGICLQVNSGTTQRIWVTRYYGNPVNLQWLDPSTLAVTNTGQSFTYDLGGICYMEDVDSLFVSARVGTPGGNYWIVEPSGSYSIQVAGNSGSATGAYQVQYLPDYAMVLRGDYYAVNGFDRTTGTKVATFNRAPSGSSYFLDATYEPAYQEFYCGNYSFASCWVAK